MARELALKGGLKALVDDVDYQCVADGRWWLNVSKRDLHQVAA